MIPHVKAHLFTGESLVKSPSFGETFRDLAGESLVIPRRILDLMEHVKSEDLAVADVPQQKDPEAGADGLHETLEALWRCLDLSEESREYVSLCFTSNRKNEVPLSLQSLLAAGCQWPGPGRSAEVPPLPTTHEELILSDQELKEMRMRHWPQLLTMTI